MIRCRTCGRDTMPIVFEISTAHRATVCGLCRAVLDGDPRLVPPPPQTGRQPRDWILAPYPPEQRPAPTPPPAGGQGPPRVYKGLPKEDRPECWITHLAPNWCMVGTIGQALEAAGKREAYREFLDRIDRGGLTQQDRLRIAAEYVNFR